MDKVKEHCGQGRIRAPCCLVSDTQQARWQSEWVIHISHEKGKMARAADLGRFCRHCGKYTLHTVIVAGFRMHVNHMEQRGDNTHTGVKLMSSRVNGGGDIT